MTLRGVAKAFSTAQESNRIDMQGLGLIPADGLRVSHTAQPALVWGLQLPRKMLNSITAALAKQEAGRGCSQLPGATSLRSKSRLCSQFHVNLEKRQKPDCWSPCKVVTLQQSQHSGECQAMGCLESGSGPSLLSMGLSPLGEAHTIFTPANLSEHQTGCRGAC